MEMMSALDALFLDVEDAVTHMHIGSVGIFEGPAPGPGEVQSAVAARLPQVPRYRQKVRFVPLALGRPAWVDDPHFNLEYHVRRTALPAPGGDDELRNLVGRVMSQQLDRAKPLWEMWVAEGLDDGRWAVISKVHHCMVDGVSGTDLMTVILSKERAAAAAVDDGWEPAPEPSSAALLTYALAQRAANPFDGLRTVLSTVRGPRRVARQTVDVARGFANLRTLLSPNPSSTLNGPIGPHRRWDWARARLVDIKQIRGLHGGTINDVVLAVITGGFRELLLSRGDTVEGRVLRTLVPVSVRADDAHGTFDNKVSAMFAELPVGLEDPVERVHSLHEQMQHLKHSGQAVAAERLTALGGFAPAMLLALGGRVATRLPQSSVNTVTTNVPGPQYPLYLAQRRMLEAFPFVPLGGHVRVGVAIFSYDGGINFGVTGDRDTAPDIGVLCRAIERGVAELLGAPSPKPAARRAGTGARP
jgi:diacylglycerol O-acyltransferase / wax synthase